MVFEGKTRASIKMFLACIKALDDYKLIYAEIAKAHNTLGNLEFPWNLDEKVIFSNVDAFIFRCKDMIEVCETMIVFGRFDETDPIPRPRFGGQRGPEFEKTCEKVEEILKECVENVKKVRFRSRLLWGSEGKLYEMSTGSYCLDYSKHFLPSKIFYLTSWFLSYQPFNKKISLPSQKNFLFN